MCGYIGIMGLCWGYMDYSAFFGLLTQLMIARGQRDTPRERKKAEEKREEKADKERERERWSRRDLQGSSSGFCTW